MHFLQVMSDTIQALTVTVLSEETKWVGHTVGAHVVIVVAPLAERASIRRHR
jgi:hypothetical protein